MGILDILKDHAIRRFLQNIPGLPRDKAEAFAIAKKEGAAFLENQAADIDDGLAANPNLDPFLAAHIRQKADIYRAVASFIKATHMEVPGPRSAASEPGPQQPPPGQGPDDYGQW